MDKELKEYLEAMEARIGERFATVATKADLEAVETRLLTEFHKWASPFDARARTHTAALRAIDLEMEALTERVEKLEGKKPS